MIGNLTAYYDSPLGVLEINGSEDGVISVLFVERAAPTTAIPGCLRDCVNQLDEYFTGRRKTFVLKLDARGTEFQKRVWHELAKIAFGKTVSYRDVARAIGSSQAVRAVGSANGQNPISIIIPCHRVIGSDGTLTGYGGGLWRKEWLLNFEKGLPQPNLFQSALAMAK